MDLHYDFAPGHRVMMHVGIEIRKTAGWEICHLAFVKVISHADFKRPEDDGDVFPLRVPMGRDPASVRHLQTHGVITTGGCRVALEHGELRARGYDCRCRPVWNGWE
jgi:hypothetical protein